MFIQMNLTWAYKCYITYDFLLDKDELRFLLLERGVYFLITVSCVPDLPSYEIPGIRFDQHFRRRIWFSSFDSVLEFPLFTLS